MRYIVILQLLVIATFGLSQISYSQNTSHKPFKSLSGATAAEKAPVVMAISPSEDSRVLISAKLIVANQGNENEVYPSPHQHILFNATTGSTSADAKIRITARVKGNLGQQIYFEVIDPDDPSPYPEDMTPDTAWSGLTTNDFNIQLETTPNSLPDDNRDPNKNGRLSYNHFQVNCFPNSSHRVQIGSSNSKRLTSGPYNGQWEVWTTLRITDDFAGDNYIVRATGEKPNGTQYYDQQTKLNDKYKSSGVLTAWKRIYFEKDMMYRTGSLLSVDAAINDTAVTVADASVFQDAFDATTPSTRPQVRILSAGNGMEVNLVRITNITGNILTLDSSLGKSHLISKQGFVGLRTGINDNDFYTIDTSNISTTFNDAYVEIVEMQSGGSGVPKIVFNTVADLNEFSSNWFNYKNKSNCIHLVGATSYSSVLNVGVSLSNNNNISCVLFDSINSTSALDGGTVYNLSLVQKNALAKFVLNHEFVHQFDDISVGNGHDHEYTPDGNHSCIMDVPPSFEVINGAITVNQHSDPFGGVPKLGLNSSVDATSYPMYHIYLVRDAPDGL